MKQKELCFTRQHLDMDEVAYHDYALAVSHSSGIFYRDDRRDAEEFRASKSRICRIAQAVERKGFMVLLEQRKRLPSGIFTSGKYQVLNHAQWAAEHVGECRAEIQSSPTRGTGYEDIQSQNQGLPVPPVELPVPAVESPVPPVVLTCPTGGTKIREEENREEEIREERERGEITPVPTAGQAALAAPFEYAADAARADGKEKTGTTEATGKKDAEQEVLALAMDLYRLDERLTLSGKSKAAAARYLQEFPRSMVLNAFSRYYDTCDSWEAKHAVRTFFADDAGRPHILGAMELAKKYQETERLLAEETAKVRAEVEVKLAELERQDLEEADEEVLGGSPEPRVA